MSKRARATGVVFVAILVAGGTITATASTRSSSGPNPAPVTTPYHPAFDAANFGGPIDNPWLPLEPGTVLRYRGVGDDGKTRELNTVRVTHRKKRIMGVEATVVLDQVFSEGKPEERTFDWYAQDKAGNVWVVDMRGMNARERAKFPDARPAGHTVMKFDANGRLLMTIGTPGVAGDPPNALTEPCAVVVAPSGDIFISEGHSGQQPKPSNMVARISRFSADGRFIRSFGKLGSGPGEFKTPHDIAMDGKGRLFVASGGNHRIQILDQDGKFIAEWKQYGRPSGIAMREGLIYVADSESNGVAPNPGWKRGIRVGDLSNGRVLYRIPDPLELKGTSAAEGVAVDAMGDVYGGEVGPRQLSKHVKR